MNNHFLHTHPSKEVTLGVSPEHVIIDKKDWREAMNIMENFPPNTFKISTLGYNPPVNKLDPLLRPDNDLLSNKEGIKHDSDKPRFDLIPADALEEVAKVYAVGAKKYGDRNWELGMTYSRLFRALMSHSWAWWKGERDDSQNKLHHLTSVVFNALALLHYEINSEKFKKFDNRGND